ncbi:hypothetical protein ZWY2020_014048 [Hordeum vulgare]|nr:hypothetical protein ZWY2020_014048 [Hordeum vulgare]
MDAMELSWGARCAGLAFFVLSILVVALAAVLLLVRRWPWCSCHVCRTYLTGSWARTSPTLATGTRTCCASRPGTVHIHVLGCTVTANPANVEYMLNTNFDNFPKCKRFAALLCDLLGGGIFNVDGDAWRHQRKMASLELSSVTVRSLRLQDRRPWWRPASCPSSPTQPTRARWSTSGRVPPVRLRHHLQDLLRLGPRLPGP